VYASFTTTKGSVEGLSEVAAMAGEAMLVWLRESEGFEGLLILTDDTTGTTRVITFWRDREAEERNRESRMRLRDRMSETVEVRVEETASYDVSFAHLGAKLAATRGQAD